MPMNGSRSRTAQNTRSADGLILDPVVEKTLEHLTKRRDELRKQIAEHQEALKLANKELAKVDQAIVGLTALGRQTLLEKAGLALAFAGAGRRWRSSHLWAETSRAAMSGLSTVGRPSRTPSACSSL